MHIVVIGNGIAGDTVATTVRALDKDVKITVITEEQEPLYSPCVFPYYIAGELEKERVFLRQLEYYQMNQIDIMFQRKAVRIDPAGRSVRLDEGELKYDKLVIATGSQAVVPPIKGVDKDGVFTLKSFRDLVSICSYVDEVRARQIALIGAGPINVEVAIALRKRGYNVYIIELLDRILPRLFDEQPAAQLQRVLEQHGIEVFTGERLKEIKGNGKVEEVITDKRGLDCDVVLLAVGMRPRTELARDAGIELGSSGGIRVDAKMMTSVQDIYACGDCVETREVSTGTLRPSLLWHTAKLQAHIAGCNCLSMGKLYSGSLNFTVLDVFGVRAMSSGNTLADFPSSKCRALERKNADGYIRLLIAGNTIVGMQFVGPSIPQDAGMLLGMIKVERDAYDLRKGVEAEALACHLRTLVGSKSLLNRMPE